MTENKRILLQFINDNLEWTDNKAVAESLKPKVKPCTVSLVRHGKVSSQRILKALELKAMERYQHAQKIAQYSTKH